ncbi:hypothetical protein IJ670_03165 [bacterium]|nr:hypothetical protein [bacterium]
MFLKCLEALKKAYKNAEKYNKTYNSNPFYQNNHRNIIQNKTYIWVENPRNSFLN